MSCFNRCLPRNARRWLGHGQASRIAASALHTSRAALSLSEVAQAFSEMSAGVQRARPCTTQVTSTTAKTSTTTTTTASSSTAPAGNVATTSTSMRPPPPRHHRRRLAHLLTLSRPYWTNYLCTLSPSGLLMEMDLQRSRLHYGNMILCLLEVRARLRLCRDTAHSHKYTSTMESCSSAAHEASRRQGLGKAGHDSALYAENGSRTNEGNCTSGVRCQATNGAPPPQKGTPATTRQASMLCVDTLSDELLESVLRCLVKIDLAEVGDEVREWLREEANEAHKDASQHTRADEGDVVYDLVTCILQWLHARVACFDVPTCIRMLHLLVQQRLFWADAVLATLADTLTVHSRRIGTLAECGLIFDAMWRCQTVVSCGQRVRRCAEACPSVSLSLSVPSSSPLRQHNSRCANDDADANEESRTGEGCVSEGRTASLKKDTTQRRASCHAESKGGQQQQEVTTTRRDASHSKSVSQNVRSEDKGASVERSTRNTSTQINDQCNQDESSESRVACVVHSELARLCSTLFSSPASRAYTRTGHPILNETLYRAVCAQFVNLLSQSNSSSSSSNGDDVVQTDGAHETTVKPTASNALLTSLSPTSFLFLTRALSRLCFFDEAAVSAMLPGLAPYLCQHPEHYYGPIMLLGRRENRVCDAAVLRVLMQNMSHTLRRRGSVYDSELTRSGALRHHRWWTGETSPRTACEATGEMEHIKEDTTYNVAASNDGNEMDADADEAEVEEGGWWRRRGANNNDTNDATATVTATASLSPTVSSASFMVSVIDLYSLYPVLRALWHHFQLVRRARPAHDAAVPCMEEKDMAALMALLMHDVHVGLRGGVTELLERLSPSATERMLLLLLHILAELPHSALLSRACQATQQTGSRDGEESNQLHSCVSLGHHHHPLLVELTLVWARQVSRRVVLERHGARSTTCRHSREEPQQTHERVDYRARRAPRYRSGVNYSSSSSSSNTGVIRVTVSTRSPVWQHRARTLRDALMQAGLLVTRTSAHYRHELVYYMNDDVLACSERACVAVQRIKQRLSVLAQQRVSSSSRRGKRSGDGGASAMPTHAAFARFSAVMRMLDEGVSRTC